MRRTIVALVISTLFYIISSVRGQSIFKSDHNETKKNFRVAKYDSLFWTPSDITVTFKKEPMNYHNQDVVNGVQFPIRSQLLPVPPTSSDDSVKSRAIESFERKHSGRNVIVVSLDMLIS